MVAAGMAVRKLKAIERARSINPTFLTWLVKNLITSNRGVPWNPGRMILLLLASRKWKTALLYIFRSILSIRG
jgi:hypothetical protein